MIKVFSPTDKDYISNGDAVIKPLKARVKIEDNGDYYIDLEADISYLNVLVENNIIIADTPEGAQAFRIRQSEKDGSKLKIKAYHVYYDADNLLIADSYAVDMTCAEALEHFNGATDTESPFTTYSDITTVNSDRVVRESLSECIEHVIERWGGHLVRDNWNISILDSIGQDRGVTIEYKNNLQNLKASYDWENVCTKLLPVGKDGQLLDDLYVASLTQYSIPFTKTESFSQDIEEADYPTHSDYINALKADLLEQAQAYLSTHDKPDVNYTLKCINIGDIALGDTIEVKDRRINIDLLTQVISYTYDCITGDYISVEFGNFRPKLSDIFKVFNQSTERQITQATSGLTSAIYNVEENKQDKLTAGDNIVITGDVITADYPVFTGATAGHAGHKGLVPAPTDPNKVLTSGGTWESVNTYQAGDGVEITGDVLSIESYASDEEIIYNSLITSAVFDSGLSFAVDLPKPNYYNTFKLQELMFTIYSATNQTFTVCTGGTVQSTFSVNLTLSNTNKVIIDITDSGTNFNDLVNTGYIIKYNAILKTL